MNGESGMLKAGKVLLLIGAILQALGSAFFLLFGLVLFPLLVQVAEDYPSSNPPPTEAFALMQIIYTVVGVVAAGGAVVSFLAYGKANRGDLRMGFIMGLVGCLLPPVNIVGLLGAIFLKICPEADRPPQPAWGPPQ